jgi:acetamidase/formamidase
VKGKSMMSSTKNTFQNCLRVAAALLLGAPHEYAITPEQLELRTDGHMDIDIVRAGAILLCPVKVKGGGIYLGDMHALQGDGEIAGHTCDVAGIVTVQVHLMKGLALDGPILLPLLRYDTLNDA